MSSSPMTEDQGDEIIQLLRNILCELQNRSIQYKLGSIETGVDSGESDDRDVWGILSNSITEFSWFRSRLGDLKKPGSPSEEPAM